MSSEIEETTIHIESSVNDLGGAENYLKCEFLSDSALDNTDSGSSTIPTSSDSEQSPVKQGEFISDEPKDDSENESNPLDGPVISTSTDLLTQNQTEHSDNIIPQTLHNISSAESNSIVPSKFGNHVNLPEHQLLTTSTVSLHEKTSFDSQNVNLKSPYSRSAENISVTDKTDTNETTSSNKELNKEKIITEFINQKSKASATQIVPESTTIDTKYPRLPKEILTQDLGSIYKNVHGIFSSVSGSLKNAYTQRNIYNVPVSKPIVKAKPVNTSRIIMDDIFEDESEKVRVEEVYPVHTISETIVKENNEEVDPKTEMLRLQIESLEKLLQEQRKENMLLKERTKQQGDELQSKEQMFKEQEVKVDMMSKRVEQMEREKDAAVMRYASVECTAIEARKAADNAVKAEKAAIAEVELLNNKLKSAFNEKQRICQLYDDKCHDLQTCERETSKLREDFREMEGRLKWTQNKLRMEIDAYKESSERAEKLSQQVAELEAAREAAAVNASDSIRAKQLESDLKESRAALILCRHERDELDRRLSSLSQQYESCRNERDDSISSLATANAQIAELREHNMRLEQEAAELAALRAQAALADTLSTQLQREIDRANQAEESLARERARAETCSRREAAALEHSARLTARDVAERAKRSDEEAKVQALSIDNTSLRERVSELERDSTRLKEALASETDARNRENRLLARKVAELTEELAEESKKLEWERGENAVLKKKHASAVKELNRELHRTLKRCETLEAKLTPPDASTRTGSVSSLSSGEYPPTEEILQNGHSEVNPEIQVREPDRRALIERIVSLQRSLARLTERCEFLEEHSRQLTSALRGKARLLREVLPKVPAGAIVGEGSDKNKKEIARLGGGAMAAVWGGDPNGMTLELSLEMNKRLQAVLEDTLLKNITLKENMDTLGEEIARLKQKNVETK